jgi:hypothetical protein
MAEYSMLEHLEIEKGCLTYAVGGDHMAAI